MSFTRYSKAIDNEDFELLPEHGVGFNKGIGAETAYLIRQAGKSFYDPIDDSLVEAWLFDEGKGLYVRDHGIYGDHGTITGADWVADGLDFVSGNSDYVSVPYSESINITGLNISISCWFKLTTFVDGSALVGRYISASSGYMIYFSSNLIYFYLGKPGSYPNVTSDGTPSTGVWYHICALLDNGTMKLYIDSVQQSSVKSGQSIRSNSNALLFGRYDSTYFNGIVHSIFIYNRALTAEEISNIYNAGMYRREEFLEYAI